MAFVPGGQNVDQEEQTIQDPNAPPIIPGVGGAAGAGGQGAGVGAVVPQDTQATQSPKEAGFTDVASYLSANRPQATAFAGNVADRLSESATELRGTVKQAGEQFGEQVEQGTTRLDQDLLDRAVSDPSGFAGDEGDFQKLQQQRTNTFQSPGQFQEQEFFADTQRDIKEGQRLGQLGESEAGRRELLYSLGKNPTAGQVELDQLLIGGTPGARSRIQDASQDFYTGIPEYLQQTGETAAGQLQQGRDTTRQTRQSVQERLAQSQSDLEAQINQQVETQRAEAQSRTEAMQNVLQNTLGMDQNVLNQYVQGNTPELTGYENFDQTLEDLGMTGAEFQDMQSNLELLKFGGNFNPNTGLLSRTGGEQVSAYAGNYLTGPDLYNRDINLNQFITEEDPQTQIRAGNVATPEQFADYQALNRLADTTPDLLFPDQAGIAGTAPTDLARFDPQSLQDRVSGALRESDMNAINNILGMYNVGLEPGDEAGIERFVSANPEYLAQIYYGRPYNKPAYGSPEFRAMSQASARAFQRRGYWGGPTDQQQQQYWSGPGLPGAPIGTNPVGNQPINPNNIVRAF